MTQESEKSRNPSKVLVCVDKNEESRIAVRFAAWKAKKTNGVLEILHVIEPPSDLQGFASLADKMKDERREETEGLLQSLADEAHKACEITPILMVQEGEIVEQIITAVEDDMEINLLILASAPESQRYSKLISQLSNQSGKKLTIPMMIIPGNLTDQQIEELS